MDHNDLDESVFDHLRIEMDRCEKSIQRISNEIDIPSIEDERRDRLLSSIEGCRKRIKTIQMILHHFGR